MAAKRPDLAFEQQEKQKTVRGAGRGKNPAANTAYKYRIYPTENQAVLFAKTFGCCRLYWNLRLEDCNWAWRQYGVHIYPEPRDYREDDRYAFMKEIDQQALQNVKLDQQQAWKNHWKNPGHYACPQKKKRHGLAGSYTTNAHYYQKKNEQGEVYEASDIEIDYKASTIKLPKTGAVKAVIHRKLPAGAIIKSATVSRDSAGRFFVSIGFYDPELARIQRENSIRTQDWQTIRCTGLDYSSAQLYYNELGLTPGAIKQYAKHQKMLARRQRQLSRKQKGSANYYKKLRQVNKLHRKIANCRIDFLHKLANALSKTYDVVCVETLSMKAVGNKGFHLGKVTFDNAWGMFTRFLAYKMEREGGVLVKVDQWFASSKQCSYCGHVLDDLPLNERSWICPECGTRHHRDRNAAWNILVEGVRMLVDGEVEWDGTPDVGGRSSYFEACMSNERIERLNERARKKGKPVKDLVEVPTRFYGCLPAGASCFVSAGGTPVTEGPQGLEGMPVGGQCCSLLSGGSV